MKPLLLALAFAASSLLAPVSARAQAYPTKPVRLIVGFAPGGGVDAAGRLMAAALTERLGQSFVVENRPGVGGLLAMEEVAKSPADGYTLGVGSSGPLTVSPFLYPAREFDVAARLEPIIWFVNQPGVIVTSPGFPAASVADLLKLSKDKPGTLNMASAGSGSMMMMMGENFQRVQGVKWQHVPYKGSGPALLDLAAGRVDLMFDVVTSAAPQVQGQKIKALAVTSAKRSSMLPDVPTLQELGFQGYDMGSWMGLVAPKGTPEAVVRKVNEALNEALKSPEHLARMRTVGEPAGGTPEQFSQMIATQGKRWSTIIKEANIKVD